MSLTDAQKLIIDDFITGWKVSGATDTPTIEELLDEIGDIDGGATQEALEEYLSKKAESKVEEVRAEAKAHYEAHPEGLEFLQQNPGSVVELPSGEMIAAIDVLEVFGLDPLPLPVGDELGKALAAEADTERNQMVHNNDVRFGH